VLAFVGDVFARSGAGGAAAFAMRLAVEEAFLNIVTHGYPADGCGPVDLAVSVAPERLMVTISDRATPFPPDSAPSPDLSADWENRRPGGVGWHLVRSMMDEIRYESTPGNVNRLTLVKKLDAPSKEVFHDPRG
jgi:serine/threonine-protein kinase RsbW